VLGLQDFADQLERGDPDVPSNASNPSFSTMRYYTLAELAILE